MRTQVRTKSDRARTLKHRTRRTAKFTQHSRKLCADARCPTTLIRMIVSVCVCAPVGLCGSVPVSLCGCVRLRMRNAMVNCIDENMRHRGAYKHGQRLLFRNACDVESHHECVRNRTAGRACTGEVRVIGNGNTIPNCIPHLTFRTSPLDMLHITNRCKGKRNWLVRVVTRKVKTATEQRIASEMGMTTTLHAMRR